MLRSPRFLAALVGLLVLSGCGTTNVNYVTGENQRGAYTWAQEVQIGREADQQIVAQYGVYDDAAVTAYVNRVAQSVLETSAYNDPSTPAEVRNTPFTFRVLDSPVVNAFALPGGFVYVTRGLMSYLENEAQLAVVLGHEVGHVLARHSSERAARQQLGQLGLLGAAVLGTAVGGGRVGQGILDYGGTGAQLLFLRYGRDAEREADQAGVAYAEFAGYDASTAATFFVSLERLSSASGGSLPGFLSTHPDPSERAQTIPQLAAQYDSGTETDRAGYLAAIDNMVLGEDPRQGYVENNTFYHPELRFRFDTPSGWQVQNGAQAVVIAAPNNAGAIQFTLASQSSASAAAQALRSQQGVSVSSQRSTNVNGHPAVELSGTAAQQSGALGFKALFIEQGGRVYQFLGIAPANGLNAVSAQFDRTFRSFATLTDARYLNRQPTRLDVVTASGSRSFASYLSGRPTPPGMTEEELAIMNEVRLTDVIPSGTPLKLPAN